MSAIVILTLTAFFALAAGISSSAACDTSVLAAAPGFAVPALLT